MPQSMTLPLVAGLAIVGAAGGVSLGRSAIAEINPAYFTDPEVPFHADLSPYRSPDWAQVQAAEYQQEIVPEGLGSGCVGCVPLPAVYLPEQGTWSGGYEEPPVVRIAGYKEASAAGAEPLPRDPEVERIERYASYPITEEPAGEGGVEPMLALAGTE
jgi:hypothetical protein